MTSRAVTRRVIRQKPKETGEFSFGSDEIQAISDRLSEPAWLSDRRSKAWAAYQAMPMPTLKDEAWRRTDIRSLPVDAVTLGGADDLSIDQNLMQPLTGEEAGAFLGIHPGFEPIKNRLELLEPHGVIFSDWKSAVRDHADLLKEHLGSVVSPEEGKFAALASSVTEDGLLVYIPKGVNLSIPLHSVYWAPGTGKLNASRILVIVDDGASLTYLHEFASPSSAEGEAIYTGTLELIVGQDANLKFVELQSWGRHVWNFSHEHARVSRAGRLDWIFGAVGSHLTKNFTELTLAGDGSEGRMSGFYFADQNQHLDHDTQQNHLAPHTTSDLLFKGALLGKSRSVWQGMIYVAPGAQKTDGYQANRNLVLSEQARADSIPGLEILADDVRCTHGATIGQLELEPVYYLMSRGLPRAQAERLVVDGFFSPILERVPFEGVRERFLQMIDDKMNADSAR
jgi:Fe-S cluster assembly protein SufD